MEYAPRMWSLPPYAFFWSFVALNAGDMLSTVAGILFFGLYESNPVVTSADGHPIWWLMVTLKLIGVVIFYFVNYWALPTFPKLNTRYVRLLTRYLPIALLTFAVVNNLLNILLKLMA